MYLHVLAGFIHRIIEAYKTALLRIRSVAAVNLNDLIADFNITAGIKRRNISGICDTVIFGDPAREVTTIGTKITNIAVDGYCNNYDEC